MLRVVFKNESIEMAEKLVKHQFKNHFQFEVNELTVTVDTLSKSKSNFDRQTEILEESITTLKG